MPLPPIWLTAAVVTGGVWECDDEAVLPALLTRPAGEGFFLTLAISTLEDEFCSVSKNHDRLQLDKRSQTGRTQIEKTNLPFLENHPFLGR